MEGDCHGELGKEGGREGRVQAGEEEIEVDHGLRWLPPSKSVIRHDEKKKHRRRCR